MRNIRPESCSAKGSQDRRSRKRNRMQLKQPDQWQPTPPQEYSRGSLAHEKAEEQPWNPLVGLLCWVHVNCSVFADKIFNSISYLDLPRGGTLGPIRGRWMEYCFEPRTTQTGKCLRWKVCELDIRTTCSEEANATDIPRRQTFEASKQIAFGENEVQSGLTTGLGINQSSSRCVVSTTINDTCGGNNTETNTLQNVNRKY